MRFLRPHSQPEFRFVVHCSNLQLPINAFAILLLYGVTTMALGEILHTQCASTPP